MITNDIISRNNSWCYLLTVLTSLLMLASCVPSTLNTTGSSSVRPTDAYDEIVQLATKVETTGDPIDAELLIEKSKGFIDENSKYKDVDQVYYILGTTLVQFDRPDEAIAVLDELIRYYPLAPSIGKGKLTLGLAYDKTNQHDKADALYYNLVNNSKSSDRQYASTAQKLLDTNRADRQGALEGLADSSSPSNFIGQTAMDFQVKDLNGQPLSLEQYRGKVVLLDFWATWCPPCIAEMPNVKATYAKYKNRNFEIIGISLDRGKAPLENYIEKEGIKWPQYYDSTRQVSNMYQVRAIPSTFLIDSDGVIRKTNLRGSALESAVAQLVQENMAR